MAYSLENTTDLTALGDAIRAKTGDIATMTVAQMATAVAGISGGGGSSSSGFPTTNLHGAWINMSNYPDYDLSAYIGTNDNTPFMFLFYSVNGMNEGGLHIVSYDGNNLVMNAPNDAVYTEWSSMVLSNGILSITDTEIKGDRLTLNGSMGYTDNTTPELGRTGYGILIY